MRSPDNFTILVVDDDPDLRAVIVDILGSVGYKTVEAENGELAYNLITTRAFDLIITDMIMPGGSGLELLEKIKKLKQKNLKIIVITGFAGLTPQNALEQGVAELIPKPFVGHHLIEAVKKVLF